MKKKCWSFNGRFTLPGIILLLALVTPFAQAVDWSGVEGKQITLFYPGQASWEWALTKADHSGAKKFRQGKNCKECHSEEEADIGATIVSGEKLEPDPIKGKRGSINVTVKTAHDGERLYVRLEWPEGKPIDETKMDPDYQVKVTMMFDDGHVKEATRAGCWGTCHDDAVGMASAQSDSEISKYLTKSRTKVGRKGGGENYKSTSELDQLLADGIFMEFWQAKLNKGSEAIAVDGYILDKRHTNQTPLINTKADNQAGTWTVEFSRKLTPGDPLHKDIISGKVYSLGFAIHEAYTEHRYHHISLEHTLTLDQGEADFIAVKR